jgi:hypothetical protein
MEMSNNIQKEMDDFQKEIEKIHLEAELKNQRIQLFTDLKINMIELIATAMKKELGDSITPYFKELDKYFEKAKSLRK